VAEALQKVVLWANETHKEDLENLLTGILDATKAHDSMDEDEGFLDAQDRIGQNS